jgi:hypothetical protein
MKGRLIQNQRVMKSFCRSLAGVMGLKSNIMLDKIEPMQFAKEIGVRYPFVRASSELIEQFCNLERIDNDLIYDRQGVLRKKGNWL